MTTKIIVTGANGMLGSSLCILYHNSYDVFALHRDSHCYAPSQNDFSFDLIPGANLKMVFDSIKPDLVIHCAAMVDLDLCELKPDLAYTANVIFTEYIAKACGQEIKLVYISTDQVYGVVDDYSETNMYLQPVNQYGKTKYLGEEKVAEHCPDCIIIRTNIFGWNIKPGKISSAEWIYNSLENGKEITLFDDYFFSPVYTKCLGEIIMQLVKIGFSGLINVGSPIPCSKYEFGKQLAKEFRFDHSPINKGSIYDHPFKADRARDLIMNIKKAISLGIEIPDYKASVNKFRVNQHLIINQRDLTN